MVGWADLALLALALPIFLLADWPLGGYAVAAGAWLVQRGIQAFMAGSTLARVWLIALAVLLVGLAEREAGLAAAVLSAALFTVYLATQFVTRLLEAPHSR